uniref:AAA_23 domain-containing protein n=1 Tax=Parastrongyloides trichosuri TaxID=131310 RepID=A0A0N4ZRY0_PARTI
MANLVGLKIQGVRSLSDNCHYINFDDNVTLIQGENGTGKTTIIEALNFATTGSLPNGKMQAFIHNNILAQKTRVDASVQLQFLNMEGQFCTITKRMSSTIKGPKSVAKQDEYTLTIKESNGMERSISSKVVDLNKEIAKHMGVSKALLENVIFCHQENSLWPMSDPKVLKNYFDSIFEVTKYVKAMEHVSKQIKDFEGEIKVIDTEIPYIESDRSEYLKMMAKHHNWTNKAKILASEIKQIGDEKKKFDIEYNKINNELSIAEEINKEVMILKNQLLILNKQVDDMKDIPENCSSIKEIEDEIEKVISSPKMESLQVQKDALEEDLINVNKNIMIAEDRIKHFRKDLLKHELDRGLLDQLKIEKKQIENQFNSDFQVDLCEDKSLLDKMNELYNLWKNEFDDTIKSIRNSKISKESILCSLKSELFQCEENIKLKKEDIRKKKHTLGKLNKELSYKRRSGESLDRYHQKISELEKEINTLEKGPESVAVVIEKIDKKRNIIEILKTWYNLLLSKKELVDEFSEKSKENSSVFEEVFPRRMPTRNISEYVDRNIKMVEANLVKSKDKLKNQETQLSCIKHDIIALKKSIQRLEEDSKIIGDGSQSTVEFKNNIKEELEELNSLIESNKYSNDDNIQKLNDRRRKLIDFIFSPNFLKHQSMLQLPMMEEKLNEKNTEFLKYDNEKKIYQNDVKQLKDKLEKMRSLKNIVYDLDSLNVRIEKINKDIERNMENFRTVGINDDGFCGDISIISEVQTLLNDSIEELEHLNANLKECERSNKLLLENIRKLGNLKERAMAANAVNVNIQDFKVMIEENEGEIKEYSEFIISSESRMLPIKQKIIVLEGEIKELENDIIERENYGQDKIIELNNYISRLTTIDKKLGEYNIDSDFAIKKITQQIKGLEEDLSKLVRQRNTLELKLSGIYGEQNNLKCLREQLRKKKIIVEINTTNELISQKEIKCLKYYELKEEENKLREIVKKMDQDICEMNKSYDMAISSIDDIYSRATNEKYSLANKKIKEKIIRKVVLKKAVSDLQKYKLLLDKSIITFHSSKMAEINNVLEELWRRVYKGNDIETIKITSKMKDDTDKRKSYDYSVSMVVDGVDLDMRDRCSSGQKALACILIRVALSDVFCFNFPVLALDEPTTNLDNDKVENIAEMLTELSNYQYRGLPIVPKDDCCIEENIRMENCFEEYAQNNRPKRNFQLIVITHDESLVSLLHRNFKPQSVYKLTKDINGISTLKAHKSVEL